MELSLRVSSVSPFLSSLSHARSARNVEACHRSVFGHLGQGGRELHSRFVELLLPAAVSPRPRTLVVVGLGVVAVVPARRGRLILAAFVPRRVVRLVVEPAGVLRAFSERFQALSATSEWSGRAAEVSLELVARFGF